MFGDAMPSHGFFIRHARNIQLSNIEIVSAKEDLRPAFVLRDVQDADFFRVRTPRVKDIPTFVLNKVDGFSVYRSRQVPDTQFDHAEQEEL